VNAPILALGTERALTYWRDSLTEPRPLIWFAALALALIPLTPTILPVTQRPATPAFFTDGAVQRYVHGGSVVIAPPPTRDDARPLRWQYDAGFGFPIAGGYFVGPMADTKGDALHTTLDELLDAPGQYVDGVWLWTVR
jgi:hypothetical protein